MPLSSATKEKISQWYKALASHVPDFIARPQQRVMIAEVARTLAGDETRHLVIEAPTGVGKTLSYLIPGIAVSRAQEKPLVVSTANVALQDQIYGKDLPLLRKIIPDLKFTAAFGRGRYVCPRNLAAMSDAQGMQGDLKFFLDDDLQPDSGAEKALCQKLQKSFDAHAWDGMRDHLKESLDDTLWAKLSTDRANCLARNCHYFRECPFFLARREIESADVVVANHALVMAALENESVLPNPKDLLLVLDEGHHLPDVARSALEMDGEITAIFVNGQNDAIARNVEQFMAQYRPKNPPRLSNPERLQSHCEEMRELTREFDRMASILLPPGSESPNYRFEMGQLPEEMTSLAQRLYKLTDGLRGLVEFMLNELNDKTGSHDIVRLHNAILQMSRSLSYLEAMTRLWQLAATEKVSNAPVSKWLTREVFDNVNHIYLHCAGIRVCDQLESLLWRRIPHAVVTSATLRSLNSFNRISELSGLDEKAGDRFVALDSPFDHPRQGTLVIPQMSVEPALANELAHLQQMAHFFRHEWESARHTGMLVLFASQRALQAFVSLLPELRLGLLVQGDQPRYRLVEEHCRRVKAGQRSALIGLQSFAEGLDLKGELLTQVHIHKVAFPPVDSPVILTEGEWLKTLKRYPFEVQSLPGASFTLIQQVGRLIRSHACHGEIVIYDRRLLSKSYGKRLLAALPVFPIEQRPLPDGELPSYPAAGKNDNKRGASRQRRGVRRR
ncbi:ATP-dependent DNA helicase DinG [Enterobacillus tribolii]|uniref:ATP-dependent DNA helicase DinG n=1 Tax=Enterobacillus tribolii TaxID=1487935 RepID=A0A370QM11_9GAMM|nr:ATP-dependent DNA helicase DinG [Enterobacillus tribolii]MBW7982234.1 ATP-dependent DNA helicase DinG [Enterobacillus tribolii]RDK89403.1 ATP-dependent DNA helicase DinG [Enterobacillus tribolii]